MLIGPLRLADRAVRALRPARAGAADASHPQYAGGDMTYGETVITLPYIRER